MAVYVDDMHLTALGTFHSVRIGRSVQMCHMLADSDDELHAMADLIGLDRRWWQSPDKASGSHYDVVVEHRELALSFGAIEITMRQAAAMNTRRRITGELGVPDEAIAWLLAFWNSGEPRRPLA